jgi:hypothetical protein
LLAAQSNAIAYRLITGIKKLSTIVYGLSH